MTTIQTADGTALQLTEWTCGTRARGTVLLVHGLGEHAGRYAWLAGQLNGAGWHVAAYDHRGHGRSGGPRGVIPSADAMLEDLARMVDHVRAERPGPLVLLGHSMGGLIAARFVAESVADQPAPWARPVEALVLSSPALALQLSAIQRLLLAVGVALAPDHAQGNGLKPAWISRDPAVVQAYVADSLVHDRITPRLVRFIVDGGARVLQSAPRWATPTLLLWAQADRCVAPRGSAAFVEVAPNALVQARGFEGLFHEIFNEPEKAEVTAELLRWLARQPFAGH